MESPPIGRGPVLLSHDLPDRGTVYLDLYQRVGAVIGDIPENADNEAITGLELEGVEYFALEAANHAATALLDALAVLVEVATTEERTK